MNSPDYEGVDGGPFTGPQLTAYRNLLLEKTAPIGNLIANLIEPPFDVLEIGSGNGRLLIWLHAMGYLTGGTGVEASESRYEFAIKWRDDTGADDVVDFLHADVLTLPKGWFEKENFDVAVCITGCFNYFRAISAEAESKVLNLMRESATTAVFELYRMPKDVSLLHSARADARVWHRLPAADPWDYYLSEWLKTTDPRMLVHDKVFLGPNGERDARSECLYYYSVAQFIELLEDHGFRDLVKVDFDDTTITVVVR